MKRTLTLTAATAALLLGVLGVAHADTPGQTVVVSDSFQYVVTGDGPDTVSVTGTGNYVSTLGGNDKITVKGFDNAIVAGSGDDTIDLRGTAGNNSVDCGPGFDTVLLSKGDTSNSLVNCERVIVS